MNLTQAEAIASLYEELIKSIDHTKIPLAQQHGYNNRFYEHKDIDKVYLEDGQVVVKWSVYAGCGEYDRDETYHSLESLFPD